jgi:hypothetical protein
VTIMVWLYAAIHNFCNIFIDSVRWYFSQSCLRLLYRWRTGKYCISSVADCKEVLLTGCYLFSVY